ncbi:MAG: SRPBCC domain-containing protein [Phycisphaerales bacterium]
MNALSKSLVSSALVLASTLSATAEKPEVDMSREIRVQRVVPASIGEVWASWTTGEGFEAFTGAKAEIEPVPGGSYFIRWVPEAEQGSQGSEGCEVLAAHHEKMLSFSWNAPPQFPNVREERTTVSIYFDAEGPDRTRVTLYHHGYPSEGYSEEWDNTYEYFAKAWPTVVEWLVDHHTKASGADEAPTPGTGWMYVPRPARDDFFTNPDPDEGAKVGEHFRYLQEAIRSGTLVLAGPCTDFKGPAVVIFHAKDEDAARAFMENDPAIAAGVFNATLHPMNFSLLRERDRR